MANAGVPTLSPGAHPPIKAGVRVAQVDFGLAVVTGEARRTAAAKAGDGVDGPEEDRGRGQEGGGAIEAQHRHALHVVLAGLAQAHVVVEREDLPAWLQVTTGTHIPIYILLTECKAGCIRILIITCFCV